MCAPCCWERARNQINANVRIRHDEWSAAPHANIRYEMGSVNDTQQIRANASSSSPCSAMPSFVQMHGASTQKLHDASAAALAQTAAPTNTRHKELRKKKTESRKKRRIRANWITTSAHAVSQTNAGDNIENPVHELIITNDNNSYSWLWRVPPPRRHCLCFCFISPGRFQLELNSEQRQQTSEQQKIKK